MEDKRMLLPEKSTGSLCISVLVALTTLLLCGVVAVATLTFLEMTSLEVKGTALRGEIDLLKSQLESSRAAVFLDVEHLAKKRELLNRQTNLFEEILAAQRSVFEKFCHEKNATCPKGQMGVKGVQGEAGSIGINGTSGPLGVAGVIGEMGPEGLNGTAGDAGHIGKTGYPGPMGPLGDKGPRGDSGPNGTVGSAGPVGSKGSMGTIGATGLTGSPGTPGLPGSKGPTGVIGDAGAQGANGTRGVAGPKGQDVKKLLDGCQCLKQPAFRRAEDDILNLVSRGRRDLLCEATGNPVPEVTITRLDNNGQIPEGRELTETGNYRCLATSPLGSASKQLTVVRM